MEHLEQLSKVLRYAGLNLNPQIIKIVLDAPTTTLIKNLDKTLKKNPNPTLSEIDDIVLQIQEAQAKVAEAKALKEKKNIKPVRKPRKTLEKA